MFAQSHLRNAASMVALYTPGQPFSLWLKQYFRQHKKFGSKDRKAISHLCYCYFRLGHAFREHAVTDRMKMALFLCSEHHNELLGELEPAWNEAASRLPAEKFALLGKPGEASEIFPWNTALSPGIDVAAFNASFLLQPKVYVRIRPGREKTVRELLDKHKIA